MFSSKFVLTVVDPAKGVVKLSPTKGTIAKAFMPTLVLCAASYAIFLYAEYLDEKDPIKFEFTEPPSED